MEKTIKLFFLLAVLACSGFMLLDPGTVFAGMTLPEKMKGRILLQVQGHGEAWYVSPQDKKRYYLGRPSDAFDMMVRMGLGAKHSFITGHTVFPQSVSGKILIDVDDHGKAYYVYPKNLRAYYLGRPADAFAIMKNLGLGITDNDLGQIGIGVLSESNISSNNNTSVGAGSNVVLNQDTQTMNIQIFNLTNGIRKENGLAELQYSEGLIKAGENHAKDMIALGYFTHNREGKTFYDFVDELGIKYVGVGENIAFGYRTAQDVVNGWMDSPGHKANMLGDYTHFGVGAIKDSQGRYYYSEYFTKQR